MTGETLSHGRYTRSSLFRLLSFTTIRVSMFAAPPFTPL